MHQELLNKKNKLAVLGLGYVGLPIALEFAGKINVIGFDINDGRLEKMRNGIDPSGELVSDDFKGTDLKTKSSLSAAIAKSGTITLELALMGVPMAVVYRLSPISHRIIKTVGKMKYVSLPNLILDKAVVKEFIQDDFKPDAVSKEMIKILTDKAYSNHMKQSFSLLNKNDKIDSSKVVINITAAILKEAGI